MSLGVIGFPTPLFDGKKGALDCTEALLLFLLLFPRYGFDSSEGTQCDLRFHLYPSETLCQRQGNNRPVSACEVARRLVLQPVSRAKSQDN
jgi:hypothetical protein